MVVICIFNGSFSDLDKYSRRIRRACRADWWGGCWVSVAVKPESLVWVVVQHFWIPFITATLKGARPMSRSGQPTCHYCCTLLGQGDTTTLTTTKLHVLIFLIPKAEQMYIWCARLGSSQSVKISDFPPAESGVTESEWELLCGRDGGALCSRHSMS